MFDPDWLTALQRQGTQPPLRARLPLLLNGVVVGSVEDAFFSHLVSPVCAAASALPPGLLARTVVDGVTVWQLRSDQATQALNQLALALRTAGLGGVAQRWRDEQLAVTDAAGTVLASIERGAVRALGLATHAVHLLAANGEGKMWIQQRAFNKPTDPGRWDTLMGGMVPASDTATTALARETWEEAGLRMDQLQDLRWGGELRMCKPDAPAPGDSAERADMTGTGVGYIVERVDWYRALLPDPVVPHNQDGEVAQFACVDAQQLRTMLQQGQFTTEAALLLVQW